MSPSFRRLVEPRPWEIEDRSPAWTSCTPSVSGEWCLSSTSDMQRGRGPRRCSPAPPADLEFANAGLRHFERGMPAGASHGACFLEKVDLIRGFDHPAALEDRASLLEADLRQERLQTTVVADRHEIFLEAEHGPLEASVANGVGDQIVRVLMSALLRELGVVADVGDPARLHRVFVFVFRNDEDAVTLGGNQHRLDADRHIFPKPRDVPNVHRLHDEEAVEALSHRCRMRLQRAVNSSIRGEFCRAMCLPADVTELLSLDSMAHTVKAELLKYT